MEDNKQIAKYLKSALKSAQDLTLEFVKSLDADSQKNFWETKWVGFKNPFQPPCQLVILELKKKHLLFELVRNSSYPNFEIFIEYNDYRRSVNEEKLRIALDEDLDKIDDFLSFIAREFISQWEQQKAVQTVKERTSSIRSEIKKVPNESVRTNLEEIIDQIDEAVHAIREHDSQIESIRKLIGHAKEFQDWRMLISDIEVLKMQQNQKVPLAIFNSEIKRLDEAIGRMNKEIDRHISKKEITLRKWHIAIIAIFEALPWIISFYLFLKLIGFLP